jgi:maltose O-acetyltransferase
MSDLTSPDAAPAEPARKPGLRAQLKEAWSIEFSNLRWRLMCFALLARLLPAGRMSSLRTTLIRAIGLHIGRGTRFQGMPKIQSNVPGSLRSRLRIGADCSVGSGTILEFGEVVTIGDRVVLEDGVVILTTTHQLGSKEHRAGAVVRSPVLIGNDVRIGSNSIILPGANIGDGACVLPDSVVNAAVGAGVTVSGIPARPVRPA